MNQNIEMLSKLMDLTAHRQRVLANNLANANTPGYVRKDVHFQDAMVQALERDSVRMDQVQGSVVEDENEPLNERGNNVTIQKEIGEISQNHLLYNFAAEMTGRKLAGLRDAISKTK